MHAWRDGLATAFVAIGLVVYGAWVMADGIAGFQSVGAVSLALLVVGIAASASAVVPGFGELLTEGSRLYLAVASALGGLALGVGIWGIVGGDGIAVTLLAIFTVSLWAMSTARRLGVHMPEPHLRPR